MVLSGSSIIASFIFRKKEKYIPQWLMFISIILILIAAIMLLCSHKSLATVLADSLIEGHNAAICTTIYNNSKIGFGIWGSSLFVFLSSFFSLISLLFDGTIDKVRNKIGII